MGRTDKDDPYRPCENPDCGAVDSTHCAFRTTIFGTIVPKSVDRAWEVGCRVVRFQDRAYKTKREGPNGG